MADIPTHNLVFQFPDDGGGDPARGGGDGGMSSVLETLKHIQVNVGAINGNVRAILDTLRRIATSGRSLGGEAGIGSREGRGAGVGVERVFHVDPRKAIVPYRGAEGQRVGGEEAFSPSRIYAENLRRARRMNRVQMLPPASETGLTVWQPPTARIIGTVVYPETDPRYMLPPGAQSGRSSAIALAGGSGGTQGPGGALALRQQGGPLALRRAVADAVERRPSPPPFMGPQSSDMILLFGRMLAVVQMIRMTLGTIKDAIAYFPRTAIQNRQELGKYGLSFAQMNAEMRVAEIIDKYKIANNASVVASGQRFTDKQMIALEATRSLRAFGTQAAFSIGGLVLDKFSDIGMIAEGMLNGDNRIGGLGAYGIMRGTLLFQLGRMMFPDKFTAADIAYNGYRNQLLQQARQSQVGMFVDPLVEMTGGRFSMDRAYPGNSNETNWWSSRP